MKKLLIPLAAIALLITACGGGDTTTDTTDTAPITHEEATPEAAAPEVAPGVDAELGPQEWYDEVVYRANNCASQSLAHQGIAMCAIRGTDMANDSTMLVGYIDQDEAGVQDRFSTDMQQQNMIDSFAGRVGAAKAEGEPRLQHVTHVRIIATGGEGMFSGWQKETEVF